MKRFLLALLCCIAVAAVGCTDSTPVSGSPPVAPPEPIPFETLFKGCLELVPPTWCSPCPPVNEVIENQADLEAMWAQFGVPEPVPAVDFNARTVVAVFGEFFVSPCYSITITSISQTGTCTKLTFEYIRDCVEFYDGDAIAPAHIISIPKTGTPICFERNCSWGNPSCYDLYGPPDEACWRWE